MNPDPESELVTEVQPRAAVLRAMAARLATSVKSLGAATLAVFGLLGTGLVALVAWRHDAITVTVVVAAVVVVLVVIAWFRAEAEHQAVRAGYVAFRRRLFTRYGYFEVPNDGVVIPNSGFGVLGGFPRPGSGGDGGLGGSVRGRGNASGGEGGNGASGLSGGRLGPGGNGGQGGGGGSVIGRGDALGGRGGAGGFPGGGGGGGGLHGTVTPGDDDPDTSADPPASQ